MKSWSISSVKLSCLHVIGTCIFTANELNCHILWGCISKSQLPSVFMNKFSSFVVQECQKTENTLQTWYFHDSISLQTIIGKPHFGCNKRRVFHGRWERNLLNLSDQGLLLIHVLVNLPFSHLLLYSVDSLLKLTAGLFRFLFTLFTRLSRLFYASITQTMVFGRVFKKTMSCVIKHTINM